MTVPQPNDAHIEWNPGPITRILLAGDEHAIADVAIILAGLPASARGQVFLEVPDEGQIRPLDAPGRFTVTWLVRRSGQSLDRALDAWLSEMLPAGDAQEHQVYAWIAAEGPARVLTSSRA